MSKIKQLRCLAEALEKNGCRAYVGQNHNGHDAVLCVYAGEDYWEWTGDGEHPPLFFVVMGILNTKCASTSALTGDKIRIVKCYRDDTALMVDCCAETYTSAAFKALVEVSEDV